MNPDAVTVDCSWKMENIFSKILWKEQLSELSEETSIENCFSMSQLNPDSGPCTLKIILKNNRKFAALQILSEVLPTAIFLSKKKYCHYIILFIDSRFP
jgi:hypothetical protein